MYKYWSRFILKITIWLIAEIMLSIMGLDDLADYSEFLQDKKLKIAEILIIQENFNTGNNLQAFLESHQLICQLAIRK
jgi:hypothetical protein